MDSSTTNAWVELIPGMDKLVGYMKAQDNKIKQLQEENKELKEQNEKLQEQNEELQKHYDNSIHTDWIAEASGEDPEYFRDTCCATTLGNMFKENKKLQEQNEKLKEENKKLQEKNEDLEGVMEDLYDEDGAVTERENKKLKTSLQTTISYHTDRYALLEDENKKLKEQIFGIKDSEITIEGFIEQIVRLGSENEKLKEENEKFKKERNTIWETMSKDPALVLLLPDSMYDVGFESATDSEDEEDKYDGDEWRWVYGKNIIEQEEYKEVVLIMAGGGDHWENWTMTPTMNYIVNKDGKHPQHGKVLVQSSCGNYVSFQDKDYECDEDECICEYEDCIV